MFEWLMTQWREIWNLLQPIGLTFVLTVIIGWQREREEHNTGIRAFPIVGMASCGYLLILGPQGDIAAQSRVLQGLITGIGFVGGGAILKDGANIRGTATAASIWNAGVIGAAVAMNHYRIGVALAILNVVTLQVLLPIKMRLDSRKSPRE
jgi:putative Mg2+ transporter-C (MgtC) family protein